MNAPNGGRLGGQERRRRFREGGQGRQADDVMQVRSPEEKGERGRHDMARVNRVIELLEQGQPVYYVTQRELSFDQGVAMAQTWADYIRVDLEHGAFNLTALGEFMRGLVAGGPTRSGHRTPTVVAELPTDGTDEMVMRANAWMIKQVLAQGVHGILLCHTESPGAVRVLVESSRFSFQKLAVAKTGQGRRGHGGQETAAPIWGISPQEYLLRADVWPLNPQGEIILGVKVENLRGLSRVEEVLAVPGIAFSEWGPGDMGMALGYPQQHDPPYPPEMLKIRERVKQACLANGLYFLNQVSAADIIDMIDEGVMILKALTPEVAEMGRQYTKRTMPW